MTPSDARRVFVGYLVGILLAQAAWILAMPAFRGIDEFDHVYKAAAVASGQWTDQGQAQNGRGGLVMIPGNIVTAASAVCDRYTYTGHDNCYPVKRYANGDVLVATAAAAYNPTYYLIVGTPARLFHGDGVDYAIRVITAVLSALVLAWALALTTRWASTVWPIITLTVGLTPVLVYSTSIASPNGLTYAGSALVWASLAALTRSASNHRGLAVAFTVGAIAMVTTHTTGPMWLASILLIVLTLKPARTWWDHIRRERKGWIIAACIVGVTTVACVGWIHFAHANSLGPPQPGFGELSPKNLPWIYLLWALQAIAAFPTLNEQSPAAVYALWALPLASVVVALVRSSTRREKVALGSTLIILVVVPTVLSAIAYPSQGLAWQGRYSLPILLGVTTLSGLALDRVGRRPRRVTVDVTFVMLAVAVAISTIHVAHREMLHGAAQPAAGAFPGGLALVGVLSVLGTLVPLLAVRGLHGENPVAIAVADGKSLSEVSP